MRSLGRLVRGLSALFWGLPLALLICVRAAMGEWLRPFGLLGPLASTLLLLYGTWQLGYFQPQERVWTTILDRARMLALVNAGLSPFLFWWNRVPTVSFYGISVALLALSGFLFLFTLNQLLQRLAAMLPDETLRHETHVFSTLNLYLLTGIVLVLTADQVLGQLNNIPQLLIFLHQLFDSIRQWLLIFLILLPLAMTMTLIWKIKEVILSSVFDEETF